MTSENVVENTKSFLMAIRICYPGQFEAEIESIDKIADQMSVHEKEWRDLALKVSGKLEEFKEKMKGERA